MRKQSTEIRLTKARAFELDPKKQYLLFLKEGAVTGVHAKGVVDELHDLGIDNVLVVLTAKNSYKLVEAAAAKKQIEKQAKRQVRSETQK